MLETDDGPQVLNYRLWELYLMDCEQHQTHPSIKDYLLWIEESY
jgi:hypothetical protein